MNRIQQEKKYWNEAAKDPEVDIKYISDIGAREFFEVIGDRVGKVLEIGCGVGRLMRKGYFGIDISEEMLEIAKKRKPECNFKLCDGRTIPYEDNLFDVVYCVLVFQHLPFEAVASYIDEAARVLKVGGNFIFQYIEGRENHPFSIHHYNLLIRDQLKANNFIFNEKEGLIHPQWTWVEAVKV